MILRRFIYAVVLLIGVPIVITAVFLTLVVNCIIIIPTQWILTGDSDGLDIQRVIYSYCYPISWIEEKLKVKL